jgi:hypothetical protein
MIRYYFMLMFDWGEFKCHKNGVETCVDVKIDRSKCEHDTISVS